MAFTLGQHTAARWWGPLLPTASVSSGGLGDEKITDRAAIRRDAMGDARARAERVPVDYQRRRPDRGAMERVFSIQAEYARLRAAQQGRRRDGREADDGGVRRGDVVALDGEQQDDREQQP